MNACHNYEEKTNLNQECPTLDQNIGVTILLHIIAETNFKTSIVKSEQWPDLDENYTSGHLTESLLKIVSGFLNLLKNQRLAYDETWVVSQVFKRKDAKDSTAEEAFMFVDVNQLCLDITLSFLI